MTSVTLFDLDALTPKPPKPAYSGPVPFGFSVDYYPPDELDAAFAAWVAEHDRFGSWARSRMWIRDTQDSPGATGNGHSLVSFYADLRRCAHGIRAGCLCVGDMPFRTMCEPCEWQAIGDETPAIFAWHDHAFPGWRELPTLPVDLRPIGGGVGHQAMDKPRAKRARAWLEDAYPDEFKVPGGPMLTAREPLFARAVSGYSPWGGYDLAVAGMARHSIMV